MILTQLSTQSQLTRAVRWRNPIVRFSFPAAARAFNGGLSCTVDSHLKDRGPRKCLPWSRGDFAEKLIIINGCVRCRSMQGTKSRGETLQRVPVLEQIASSNSLWRSASLWSSANLASDFFANHLDALQLQMLLERPKVYWWIRCLRVIWKWVQASVIRKCEQKKQVS